MAASVDVKFTIISDGIPELPDNWEEHFVWLQPLTGKWHKWNGSAWEVTSAPLIAVPPELGDTNFIGSVSADGDAGLTGQRTISGYTLTFKKGLLIGFQAP